MQSVLATLVALAAANNLNQLCQEAKAEGLDFISVELPLGAPGITDCKDGKCLPDRNTASACKLFLAYTHPSKVAIPENFAAEYTTVVDNKRPFDGINFISNPINEHAVHDYNVAHKGLNILTAPAKNYQEQPDYYAGLVSDKTYKNIVISVGKGDSLEKLPKAPYLVVAETEAVAEKVAEHLGPNPVYIASAVPLPGKSFSESLDICES